MKKLTAVVLVICMLAGLCACGKNKSADEALPPPPVQSPNPVTPAPETPAPVEEVIPEDAECQVIIDKQPGDENLTEGSTALFTVKASGFDSVRWVICDPTLVHEYDADALLKKWPVLEIEGADTETLRIKNVPAELDGYRVSAVYADKYGEVQTGLATINAAGFFTQIPHCYMFCSGAGAWRTVLKIEDDGTFAGKFSDSDRNDVSLSKFTGRFGNVKKIDGYSYSMELLDLDYGTVGETYKDEYGCNVTTTTPYGLEDGKEFIVYLPKIPLEQLPDGFKSWLAGLGLISGDTFEGYGLYNTKCEYGFTECDEYTYNMNK